MTMAAAIERRTAETPTRSQASRVVQVEIVDNLDQAETVWRALEGPQHISTPYQRFDFLAAWQRNVGEREHARPFVVIAYDAERRPLLLLPLALRRQYGARVAAFMGGKHTTFNMALWNRDFAADVTAADLDALLSKLRQADAADLLVLTQQPTQWRDLANPLALLPHQPSVNDCPLLVMAPGAAPTTLVSNNLRKRLRGKERKLQELPGYRYHVASTEADIDRVLDWFFRVKPLKMAEQKLPNVFAEPGVEDFIRTACATRYAGGRVIDIHALECDEEVIALFAGVADGYRFSMMFNTYTMSEHARFSPGLILMRSIVDHYAQSGYRTLDLGIGSDDYKRMFCKSDEPIFDSFIPLGSRGALVASALSVVNRGKHLIKHNQALFRLAQAFRRVLH
jgi:CelD/BcsL family acetyltransferase involved in cellulose biosynthesis